MQTESTTGPSASADDLGNDLATLKRNIKDLESRSLRRTVAEINAGGGSYVRQSVSPGKAKLDAEMAASTRLAVEAQITTNKLQNWELELKRFELRIDAAVRRGKPRDEIEELRDEYDFFLRKPACS